jgi:hypothetical protein
MRILRVGILSRSWLFCTSAPATKANKFASRPTKKGLKSGVPRPFFHFCRTNVAVARPATVGPASGPSPSDPNRHRASNGSLKVRIETRRRTTTRNNQNQQQRQRRYEEKSNRPLDASDLLIETDFTGISCEGYFRSTVVLTSVKLRS